MSASKHAGLVDIPALQDAVRAAAPAPGAAEGFTLVAVRGFDELVYWLGRCEDKGHLENCPDLVQPWAEFDWREVPPAAARVPLTAAQAARLWNNAPEQIRNDLGSPAALLRVLRFFEGVYRITAAGQEGGAA